LGIYRVTPATSPVLYLDKHKVQPKLHELFDFAQALEEAGQQGQAIQAYDTILIVGSDPATLALANFHLGKIYREWGELFASQRLLRVAQELHPTALETIVLLTEINRYIAQNQERILAEKARKNSDQIVSLFRISTGLKLLEMDKATQAYPLLKSRTKVYPNAAVAKHLLTDIIITEEEKNSAIEFLEEKGWLANTRSEFHSITENGLYTFYTELAKLHVDNEAYDEAASCYEQAYWLDDSESDLLYHKLICDAKSQAWEAGLAVLEHIDSELPESIDSADYHNATAQIYGLAYQSTQDAAMRKCAVQACEAALAINKKSKEISKLLKSLQSAGGLQSKNKRWWQRQSK